ncbi:MAG: nicotinate phosphoribosyltransferase [Ekhidna sp.]|nr:nicotinate phosphoribosyltransferase [Ekhidna sp.]
MNTDFYKVGHKAQYPTGTTMVYSNMTPRSDKLANIPKPYRDGMVFFGLQYILQEYFDDVWGNFFDDSIQSIHEYKEIVDPALGLDIDVSHMEALRNLGYLPIEIKALPEGSVVPIGVPCLTIRNTHPDFAWLTNYIETVLSSYLWMMCTSATTARYYQRIATDFARETCDTLEHIPFQFHDFSFRGMPGPEAAARSGMAHLTSFVGTDTIPAIQLIKDYYPVSPDTLVGASVPATEHSVMCMGGEETEFETYERLLDVYPSGIVSIVSDTWDYWQVLTDYLPRLKDRIEARNGKVVIRPDSGDPVDIICGTAVVHNVPDEEDLEKFARNFIEEEVCNDQVHGEYGAAKRTAYFRQKGVLYRATTGISWDRYDEQYYFFDELWNFEIVPYEMTPEEKGSIELLWETFGGHVNSKGYKVLSDKIGLIYGDSITPERALQIFERLKAKGFASSNVVLGIGSYTYQYVTRDTWGTAIKATYGEIDGKPTPVQKNPKTDSGTKKSLRGLLKVETGVDGRYVVKDDVTKEEEASPYNCLKPVFTDGTFNITEFETIRERIKESL